MQIASILFAAGRGRRLRPLTDKIPKPALPLLDVPLGAFALPRLIAAASPTAVNVSHLGDEIVKALRPFGPFEVLREHPEGYGTAGTLMAQIDRLADRVVTLNSDALTDLDPAEVLLAHERSGVAATIAVQPVLRGADVIVSDDLATRFIDRRLEPDAAGHRFIGLGIFEKQILTRLPLSIPGGLGEQVLAPLAATGALHVYVHEGYFADVGTPERYLGASLDLLRGVGPTAPVALPGQVVEVEGGRAYLGPDATAPDRALGPGAVVLSHATIEPGAALLRSVVMPHERVGALQLTDTIFYGGLALDP